MNESVNFLNDFDKRKHSRSNLQDAETESAVEATLQHDSENKDNNLLDSFKERLLQEDARLIEQ